MENSQKIHRYKFDKKLKSNHFDFFNNSNVKNNKVLLKLS